MALREYPCRFCDETPFRGLRYAVVYDKDKDRYTYQLRTFEARLQVDQGHLFAERLSSPNGIQVLWSHGSWFDDFQAVGRVKDMGFKGKALVGAAQLSETDVLKYVAGGLDAVDAMINSGLSIGVQFLDNPPVTWKLGEGTREKPDKMTYGALQILEVSLTPVPRIYTAGLLGPGTPMQKSEPEDNPDG